MIRRHVQERFGQCLLHRLAPDWLTFQSRAIMVALLIEQGHSGAYSTSADARKSRRESRVTTSFVVYRNRAQSSRRAHACPVSTSTLPYGTGRLAATVGNKASWSL
jgi:hypothetical protein